MKTVQFIQTTPEQIQSEIVQGVSNLLESLKADFQPKLPTEYLTREETANLLSIDKSTLWSWSKKGKLKAWSIGNRVYYKRSEIEQAIVELKY
jgi:excisionase family DNA binding protein